MPMANDEALSRLLNLADTINEQADNLSPTNDVHPSGEMRKWAHYIRANVHALESELASLRAEKKWILIATTTEDVPRRPVLLARAGEKLMAFAVFLGRHWRHADSHEVVCFEPTHYMHAPTPPSDEEKH